MAFIGLLACSQKEKILPLTAALILSVFIFYAFPNAATVNADQYKRIVLNLGNNPQGDSIQERLAINHQGVKIFMNHSLVGVGLRAYTSYTSSLKAESQMKFRSSYADRFYDRHENIWIELLAEFGGGALIIFIFLFFFLLKNIRIFLAPTLLVHYFVMGMFVQNFNLTLPILLLGLLCAMRWRAVANKTSELTMLQKSE